MILTGAYATELADRIAEHQARGCYCPACAEPMADLSMDGRDLTGRKIKGASMNKLNWTTVRCDNSGPNCPQVATEGDTVYVRDSERPNEVVTFSRQGFAALIGAARSGAFDR